MNFSHNDYRRIADAIEYLRAHAVAQPDLAARTVTGHAGKFPAPCRSTARRDITGDVTPDKIDGRRLYFPAVAHDGVDHITEGKHERVVIDKAKFESRLTDKIPSP